MSLHILCRTIINAITWIEPLIRDEPKEPSAEEDSPEDTPTRDSFFEDQSNVSDGPDAAELSRFDHDPGAQVIPPGSKSYKEFISESQAYRWLLLKLQTEAEVHYPGQHTKCDIGQKILNESLQSMSSQRPMPAVHMSIVVDWELANYIKSLHLSLSEDIWDHVLCLTGSDSDLQAVTVATYLRMTWPLTGERLGGMLLKLLQCQSDRACSCMYCLNSCVSYTDAGQTNSRPHSLLSLISFPLVTGKYGFMAAHTRCLSSQNRAHG